MSFKRTTLAGDDSIVTRILSSIAPIMTLVAVVTLAAVLPPRRMEALSPPSDEAQAERDLKVLSCIRR